MKNKNLNYLVAVMAMAFIFAPFVNAAPTRQEEGRIIAKIDFDPQSDGFSFRNYPNKELEHDGSGDLDASDLIMMFGADQVCIEGSTPEDCVLYETADRWREEALDKANGGHCDGFSVTTMRTWLNLPFRGKTEPQEWQSQAEVTNDLEFDGELANYITYYHVLQGLKEVNTFRMQTFKFGPSKIVQLLIESFQTGKEYYTLGVGMRVNGQYTRGHSILPFAVEDMGDRQFRIHVYDNNYPGQTKYVTVDGKTDSWRYHTASDPSKTANDYVGNKRTETMSLKKMSDRNRRRYTCPFATDGEGEGTSENSAGNEGGAGNEEGISFSFSGNGDLLITDPNDKRIGYKSEAKAELNEIPGAEIVYVDGGLDKDYSPHFVLPYDPEAKNHYQIEFSGKDLEQEINGDLEISGPGFVVGLEDISLDPGEQLRVTVSPDGESLTFAASDDGEVPTIFVTTEDGPDKPSYSFEVGGVAIDAGKTLTLTVDVEAGKVFFKDDDGNEDAYDIHFERTGADGRKIKFDRDDLDMKGRDSFEIDLNKWDEDTAPCVEDDDDGDGFEDETCGDDTF